MSDNIVENNTLTVGFTVRSSDNLTPMFDNLS